MSAKPTKEVGHRNLELRHLSEPRGLPRRMARLFATQVAIIGMAAVIGIFVTQLLVEDLLIRRALELEASHFWALSDRNPSHPLPDTANLQGYLVDTDSTTSTRIPPALRTHHSGYARIEFDGEKPLVHVSDHRGKRLYLVFDSAQVSNLAFFFGLMPLTLVLLLIYPVLFVVYRKSQAALSPMVRLARRLKAVDIERYGRVHLDLDDLRDSADSEVATMIGALDQFTARLDAAIERERVFTRDAGHELRTPVAVFKGSLDLLERRQDWPTAELRALQRMRRTLQDMEALLSTLLTLAREEAVVPSKHEVMVSKILEDEIADLKDLAEANGNSLRVMVEGEAKLKVPEQALRIILGNLLRNALAYTRNGEVHISVEPDSVSFKDTGMGMSREDLKHAFEPFYRGEKGREASVGHGLGLSIVLRLARQLGWSVQARSEESEGTDIKVNFAPIN